MDSWAKISRQNNRQRTFFSAILFSAAMLLGAWQGSRGVRAESDDAVEETAGRLAERVTAIPNVHGPLRLEWYPDAAWPEGESQLWQDALVDAFKRHSLSLAKDASPALLIHAQETPTEVVLTAKIGGREEIRIVSVARTSLPPSDLPVVPIRLERQLIYESPDRVLDAASLENAVEGGFVFLLYRNFEVVALRVDAKGAVQQTVPLNSANLKPSRDPRAEMTVRGAGVSVQLGSKLCEFSWDSPIEVKCRAEKPAATAKSVWRGDTLLASPCDGAAWKLVSAESEPTTRDILQVVPEGALRESSAAVMSEFPGPILGTNGDRNPESGLVVTRNLRTGNYEVYKVTLACGD